MTTITALDNDTVSIEATPTSERWNGRQVVVLDSASCPLDRAATVRVIASLASAVAAFDRAEAERQAAEAARQAAKFKRGDKIRQRGTHSYHVVIRDEDEAGTVDLVTIGTGVIRERVPAQHHIRTQRAATRGMAAPF